VFSISVAGTSFPADSGDHTTPQNGDVLVNNSLNRKVYDATVAPSSSCQHFSLSLRLRPSPGPTAAQVILDSPSPLLTVLPAGRYNGTFNQGNLSSFGLYPGVPAYEELSTAGASDYLRTWSSSTGLIGIVVFQMKDSRAAGHFTDENASGGDKLLRISKISKPAQGYLGEGTQTTARGVKLQLVQYMVHDQSYAIVVLGEFVPGAGVQTITATALKKQLSKLHGLLSVNSGRGVTVMAAAAGGAVVVLLLLAFAIRRRRARNRAGSAKTAVDPPSPYEVTVRVPVAAAAGSTNGRTGSPTERVSRPTSSYFCSWCGVQRQVNADSIHHCGSRDRPPEYCSSCGEALSGGTCSCGTLATQLSPPN
jgi:hypothetical protein